jgi:hypothetical protein
MLTFLAGDYDVNGVVDNNDYNVWRASFGNFVGESPVDGNGDTVVDAADYVIWRDNFGKSTADIAPIAPSEVSAAATGATSIQVNWSPVSTATGYSVQRRQPDTEIEFTTLASGLTTITYTDDTAMSETLYEYRVVAQNANGSSPGSKVAQAIANRSNLTVFRPQSVQPDEPTNVPIYDPFPKKPVLEADETHNNLGPGIRINFDDDNSNGTVDAAESGVAIPSENDLIEVKVDRLPGTGDLVLQAGQKLKLFYDYNKATPIPLTGGTSGPLNFTNNTVTVFVEWIDSNHGTDNLSLFDPANMMTLDSIRFHSFRSLVVVFGGRAQNPQDTDKDGSIGDAVKGGPNREGIFDVAQLLYDGGWDVMAFDEADYTLFAESVAEREIKNAIDNRFVDPMFNGGVALMGYSQGGGVVQNLIEEELDPLNNPQYLPIYGVYLDAIVHDSAVPETDWPDAVFHLLNIYEEIAELPVPLGGGDIEAL